jgi:hypothetical protein
MHANANIIQISRPDSKTIQHLCNTTFTESGWDSAVSSDWLRVGRSGNRISVGDETSRAVQTGSEAHPFGTQYPCILGTGYFPKVKQWGCCTDHPTPSSARLWIGGSYTCACTGMSLGDLLCYQRTLSTELLHHIKTTSRYETLV